MMRIIALVGMLFIGSAFVISNHKPELLPPGTVEFTEGLYFDETEISVFHWLEYQTWLKGVYGEFSQQYVAAMPDTSQFNHFHAPFAKNYFTHPAYRNYPIVCITYEQASAFCEWRTDRVRELMLVRQVDRNLTEMPCITYRLPSKEEWEAAAASPIDQKSFKKVPEVYQEMPIPYNLKGQYDQAISGVFFTSPVNQGVRNQYGMQNLFGNVAEMIDQPGIAKGGSWDHTPEESQVELNVMYDHPSTWLGFRCVCEVRML